MFRTKVIVLVVVVFVVMTAVVYTKVSSHIEDQSRAAVEQQLSVAKRSLERTRRLHDFAIVAKAEEIARWPQMAKILLLKPQDFADAEGALPNDDDFRYEVHRKMNEEVLVWSERFKALAEGTTPPRNMLADFRTEKPDRFMVLDAKGIGVARAADRAWFGPLEANVIEDFEVVETVLSKGGTLKDIWIIKGSPMNIAATPVRAEGRVVGVVVFGHRLTDDEAKRDKQLVSNEVAYFVGERLAQSSTLHHLRERELQQIVKDRKLYEFEDGRPQTVEFKLGEEQFIGLVGPLPGNPSAPSAGFIVFASLDDALRAARGALPIIWIAGLVAMFLAIGLFIAFYRQFHALFEDIDSGVMEIINGNLDYWFQSDTIELPGTMCQNLNIMVCNLSGRPLPEEDDAVGGEHWTEERMFIDEIDSSHFMAKPIDSSQVSDQNYFVPSTADSSTGLSPEILQLVREDEDTYRRRVFREYAEARRETGEPVQGITFEKFTTQLSSRAAALEEKYGCTSVRFIVLVRDNRVTLKPVPIS